jgi:hypothetical protein
MHPSSLKSFQGNQERDLKHFSLMDFISKKQNKTSNSLRNGFAFHYILMQNHHGQ